MHPPGVLSTTWLYRDAHRPIAELTPTGQAIRGTQILRILSDQTGSVRAVVDAETRAVLHSVRYDVWGNVLGETGAAQITLGYAGGLVDRDTGLVHLGTREYDPELARWTTPDPTPRSLNRYQFAGGDPINNSAIPLLAWPGSTATPGWS